MPGCCPAFYFYQFLNNDTKKLRLSNNSVKKTKEKMMIVNTDFLIIYLKVRIYLCYV